MRAFVDFWVVDELAAAAGFATDVEVEVESVRLKAAGSICMIVADSLGRDGLREAEERSTRTHPV
jgi:hypothetical protein